MEMRLETRFYILCIYPFHPRFHLKIFIIANYPPQKKKQKTKKQNGETRSYIYIQRELLYTPLQLSDTYIMTMPPPPSFAL